MVYRGKALAVFSPELVDGGDEVCGGICSRSDECVHKDIVREKVRKEIEHESIV